MSSNETVPLSADQLSELFGWPEYVVFVSMLAISAGIGVVFACKKQDTTTDFLMAGRNMGIFPVTMSLIASFLSAITLLGTPAEIYTRGTMYWMIGFSYIFAIGSAAHFYLPVFYNLQVTSAYEYLELRFSKPVRMMGSAMFIMQMTIYMAIVVYAPALALSQVTGLHLYGCVTAIFAIVIFYTSLGGMKAVMWTDVFQTIIMFGAMLGIVIKGAVDLGGWDKVWEISREGGRLEFFNFDMDPRTRHTVWGLFFGGYFTWLSVYGTNQAMVQRYLTLPSIRKARLAIWLNLLGLFGLLTICAYAGLVIYAKYADCDPLVSKRVKTADQLFPLFVMDTLTDFPGVPGLFVAGIFSGALSTVSSGLNSLAAITLEDFVKSCYPDIGDNLATKVSKMLAVMYGLISFALVFVAEQLGGVLQAALAIFGIIGGPNLGIFTLGIFFPWANSTGGIVGTLFSLTFMFWLGIGANIAGARKQLITPKLNVSVDGCLHGNFTVPPALIGESGGILEFYRISYMWYAFMGLVITVVVGLIVSFLTGKRDPRTLDKKLISPPIDKLVHKLLSPRARQAILWDLGAHKESVRKTSDGASRTSTKGNIRHSNGERGLNGRDNQGFRRDDHEMAYR